MVPRGGGELLADLGRGVQSPRYQRIVGVRLQRPLAREVRPTPKHGKQAKSRATPCLASARFGSTSVVAATGAPTRAAATTPRRKMPASTRARPAALIAADGRRRRRTSLARDFDERPRVAAAMSAGVSAFRVLQVPPVLPPRPCAPRRWRRARRSPRPRARIYHVSRARRRARWPWACADTREALATSQDPSTWRDRAVPRHCEAPRLVQPASLRVRQEPEPVLVEGAVLRHLFFALAAAAHVPSWCECELPRRRRRRDSGVSTAAQACPRTAHRCQRTVQ